LELKALETLIQILDQHRPADEKEEADVRLIRQMVLANPAIFSAETYPGHITGSALVVDMNAGQVLLHYHKSLNRWLQFGGHAVTGETDPAAIAWREAQEETGLTDLVFFPESKTPRPADIDIHPIPAATGLPGHLHLDIRYLLVTTQPEQLSATAGESDHFMWLDFDEIETIENQVDTALFRLLSKAKGIYQHLHNDGSQRRER
jgi:8-oxo-dGTP pyrophosphatase MutT (NUDIX family)